MKGILKVTLTTLGIVIGGIVLLCGLLLGIIWALSP